MARKTPRRLCCLLFLLCKRHRIDQPRQHGIFNVQAGSHFAMGRIDVEMLRRCVDQARPRQPQQHHAARAGDGETRAAAGRKDRHGTDARRFTARSSRHASFNEVRVAQVEDEADLILRIDREGRVGVASPPEQAKVALRDKGIRTKPCVEKACHSTTTLPSSVVASMARPLHSGFDRPSIPGLSAGTSR